MTSEWRARLSRARLSFLDRCLSFSLSFLPTSISSYEIPPIYFCLCPPPAPQGQTLAEAERSLLPPPTTAPRDRTHGALKPVSSLLLGGNSSVVVVYHSWAFWSRRRTSRVGRAKGSQRAARPRRNLRLGKTHLAGVGIHPLVQVSPSMLHLGL